jgi:hypothetical protein
MLRYRCGCLGVGDRIVIINQTRCDCLSGVEAARLLANSAPLLKLHVQFDVADAVVPASGVFVLKVARWGVADLGIFVTSMKMPANAPIISRIRRGSVAHRCGALQCGDQLLEMTTPHPAHNVVALKVLKAATYATCEFSNLQLLIWTTFQTSPATSNVLIVLGLRRYLCKKRPRLILLKFCQSA